MTSISVALRSRNTKQFLANRNLDTAGTARGYFGGTPAGRRRPLIGTAAHLPEHPQEPVIDRSKNTRHVGDKVTATPESGLSINKEKG